MTTFDCLPFDVIDYIMNCDSISHSDVCRLASVSKIFNCIATSNKLWRRKFSNMWPELSELYNGQNIDWRAEFRMWFNYKKLVYQKLYELSREYYYHENVSNEAFLYFKDIARSHPLGYDFVIGELESIIHNRESEWMNLTQKYYAIRALRYIRHAQLEIAWKNYLSQPITRLMSLVEGSCLISQWCQPTVPKCTSQVAGQIEDIAKLVLEKIRQVFPHHPVLNQGILKEDILPTSLWSTRQCKDIIYCINEVMFEDLKFTGNQIDYYSADTTFIDKVLATRSGISITLGIIYSAVAAKLGVACLSVNFPGHFLLKWLEHPGLDEKDGYTFIDVIEKGACKKYSDLSCLAPGYETFTSSWTESAPAIKVFVRLAWYLVEFGRQMDGEDSLSLCNALELLCLLSPDDLEHKLLLARLFMHLGINVTEAISMLQEIAANDPASQLTIGYMYQSTLNTLETQRISRPLVKRKVKLRDKSDSVKFAVGMIMRHRKYGFRCVIYGWDYTCSASQDWIKKMGVQNLLYKDKQPFYYVLVEDGTNRYAAQDDKVTKASHFLKEVTTYLATLKFEWTTKSRRESTKDIFPSKFLEERGENKEFLPVVSRNEGNFCCMLKKIYR